MDKDNRNIEGHKEEIEPKVDKSANMNDLMNHPLVKEFGIPLAKQALKKEFGIETHEKEITKRAFGRFMYALRDFIQGTWWVMVLFTLMMGLCIITLLWLRKMLGV